jgi:hypothetical protein
MKSELTLIIVVLCLVVVGCERESVVKVVDLNGDDIESAREPLTPESVIENIALAYRTRDLELYEEQLDPSFVIEFFESMPAVDGGVVMGLSYEKNMESVSEMFADAYSLTFEMTYETAVPSEFDDYPASEGYYQVNVHNFNLRIDSRRYERVLVVANGQTVFVLKDFGTAERADWKLVFEETH